MTHRTTDPPARRDLGYGADRKKTVDLIVEVLRSSRQEADLRQDKELLERRPRLNRQPWRRPRRLGAEGASTMELIRRFEARHSGH
ncbi:MAG TPA: hypothetical protein VJ725_04640 [Thermoanaerobaculia bacterium]|nr:hypothetical protein [Thermoanaerobaculia bacterium]